MLEQAEQGRTLSDRSYETTVRSLRSKLLAAHFALRETKRQVIVIVGGADGAGKGELVHRLNEWLDPRGVVTHAFWDASDEDEERPHFYRFWKAMPGAGRVGIFFGSWYTRPIIERVTRERRKREFGPEMDRIVAFERMLAEGGTVLVKLWMHLSKDAQRTRLQQLEKDGRIGPDDWAHFKSYDRFREVSERALAATHEPWAAWHPVDATDRRYREVAVGRLLLSALTLATAPSADGSREARPARGRSATKAAARRAASASASAAAAAAPALRAYKPGTSILDAVDLTQRLTVAEYEREMERLKERLARLAWAAREQRVASVFAFEGWDAAGKGSAIRRVKIGRAHV